MTRKTKQKCILRNFAELMQSSLLEQKSLCLESTQPEPQELTQPNSANFSESPSSNDHQTAGVDSQIESQQPEDQNLARETPKQDEVQAEIVKIESKITALTSLKNLD